MAPLTRSRSEEPGDVPAPLMAQYYGQRASSGGFMLAEATNISASGRGWYGAPGMYSDEQVAGWKVCSSYFPTSVIDPEQNVTSVTFRISHPIQALRRTSPQFQRES